MANKWNQQEQGAKRRRSNQGTRGTARTQPAASNPNKNTKSTDTNRNSGRTAAAKPAPKAAPKAAPKQTKPKTVYYRSKDDAKPVYKNPAKTKPKTQKPVYYSKDNARPVSAAEYNRNKKTGNVRQTIGGAVKRAVQANASAAKAKPAFRSRDYGKEQIKRPGEMNVTDYAWQTQQQDHKAAHNLSNQRKARQMYVESGQAALQRDLAKLDMRSGSDRRGKSAMDRLSIDYKTGKWYWDGKEMTQAQFDQQFPMGLSDPTAREMAEKAGYIVNTRYFPTKEDEKDKKQEIGWVARNMDKYAGLEADNVSDADAYDLMANRRKFAQAQAAGDKEAMARYHQANEDIRAKYGYSGGTAGDQILRGNVSANEYAQLNETGDAALSNARRRLVNARTPAERERIQKEIDWILTNPENQAGEENKHQIRDLTKGSVLSSIGNTAVQLRNIRDMNKYAGADDAYNAVPKLWQRVSELYDQMGNTTDEKQQAKIQKQIDWLTDQATAMEQEQEKWATDPNSPYFDPTVAERLGMPTSVQPNRWDEMAERGDQLIAGAKEGMNAGQSFAADLYSNAIQMIPTTAAGLIPGAGGASVGAKLWNAARGAAQIGALSQMGLAAGGARYRELVDRNVPRDQARTDALLATAIEMGTEALPLHYMGKLVGGTQRIGRTIPGAVASSVALEGTEEGVSYAANALWSWMRGYEQDRFDWGEMGKSMLAGGIMGGLHAGLGVAVNRAVTHLTSQGREQDANRVQAYMDDIDGIMEQSRQYEEMVRQGALSAEEGAAIQSQLQQDLVGKMQSIQDHVRTIDSYQSMADQGVISQAEADQVRDTYGEDITGRQITSREELERVASQRLYQAALAANAMNTETPAQAEARQAAERTGRVQDMYRRGQYVMGAYQADREAQLAREIREAQQTETAEATTATSTPVEQTKRMGEGALVQANSALQQAAEARARAKAAQNAVPVNGRTEDLLNARELPLASDEKTRKAQEKLLRGEPLTLSERLGDRDGKSIVKKLGDYDLKPDHAYRVIPEAQWEEYQKDGKITRNIEEYVEGENNGGVDWYLGAAATKYGNKNDNVIILETPAAQDLFQLADDNGTRMVLDPTVRHIKSSSRANPVQVSDLTNVFALNKKTGEVTKLDLGGRNTSNPANRMLTGISGTMGEKGSQSLMTMAGELNNTTAVRDFVRVYNQALMGNTGIEAPRSMTQAEFNRATEAGIADRIAGITLDLKLSEKAAGRNKNAGVNWSDSYVRGMDRQTAKTLDAYAKTIGAKIEFTEFTGANGSFVRSGNVITIAKDNPLFQEDPVLFVMGHESTHRMQDLDVESYNAFRDYVMSLPGSNEALEETLATYRSANAFKPGENQRYAAMDEVTADYAGRLLRDHEELRQFIRDMQQPKVLRALLKAFRAVRDMLPWRERAQADEAVRLLEEAIKGASARVKGMERMTVADEAREFSDAETLYSIRKEDPPEKTGVAYKVFFAKNGQLYPPMVANPGGEGTPVGVWLNADVGQQVAPSKSGRQQVKAGGKGTQGGSGSLAFRPGWHLGDIPRASQFDRKNPETGKKELFPANFVWAECEYAADVDYQDEAMSYGYTENGKFRHAYAGLPRLPENGYYRYRTNPKPDTVPWIITGAMRVTRILTDAETDAICRENGVEPAARQGGPMTAERMEKELGIKAGDTTEESKRFSLSAPVEETKTLVALHNLDTEKIDRSLRLGAFPAPSIAVVKAKEGHSKFGPISIVFPRSTIDPEASRKNRVYGSDAWTPTHSNARVEYPVNYDALLRIEKQLEELSGQIAGGTFRGYSLLKRRGLDDDSSMDRKELAERLSGDDEVRAAYLAAQGRTLEPVMREKEFDAMGNDFLQTILDTVGEQEIAGMTAALMEGGRLTEADKGTLREIWRQNWINSLPKRIREKRSPEFIEEKSHDRAAELSDFKMEQFVRHTWDYYENHGVKGDEIDRIATSDKLRAAVNDADVAAWMEDQLDGLLGEPGVYNGKEPYTASGNKRSFATLHYPYTAEGIVRAMYESTSGSRGQNAWGVTANTLISVATPEYGSVDEIHADEDRLRQLPEEEYKALLAPIDAGITSFIQGVKKTNKAFAASDYEEGEIIASILMDNAGKKTAKGIQSGFRKEGYTLSPELAKSALDIFKQARAVPTGYFEAKPERVVGFDEVLAAVVPSDMDAGLRSRMEEAGMRLIDYERDNEQSRMDAVNSVEGARFSITPQADAGVDNVVAFSQNGRRSDADMDETRIRELRASIQDAEDQLEFADVDDLSDVEIKRLQSRLMKDRNELDKLVGKERSLTRKTSIQDLLDNLDDYRRTDLESLAEQISDGAWDDYEEMDDADLRDGIREMLEERAADMSPLEAQAAKYGFSVRPPERFSIGTEGYDWARLMRENQQLKEKLEYWRGQVKKSDRTKADPKEVRKLAKSLRTDYSTEMDAGEITQRLQAIYDGIGRDWSYDRAYEEAGKLARDMIEQATATEDYLYAEYEPMRKFFKDTPLVVTKEMQRAIPDYNEWRKPLFGKLRLTGGEQTNVDQVFQEAVERWPEFFNEEVSSHSLDQLDRIVEVLDNVYRREEINPFEDDMSAPAGYLATEIMDMFWDVPAVKKTFADRAEARVLRQKMEIDEAKAAGRERVQKVREQKNQKIKKTRTEAKAEERERMQAKMDRKIEETQVNANWHEAKSLFEAEWVAAKRRHERNKKYKQAIQKVREQRDRKLREQSEKYLTAKKKRSQKQKEREMRAKIQRHVNKLSTKLTRPTDTQHIPEALVDTVRTALESINLSSGFTVVQLPNGKTKRVKDGSGEKTSRTQAFEAMRKMYQEMETNGSEVVIDPDLIPNISDIIGFADTPIANLGLEDLNTIWNTVKAIENSISTFNKALGRAKFETISQPAFGIRDYLTGRKDRGDYRGLFRQMDKLLNFTMLIPEAYFLRMGNSGKEVFRMLRDAQDRHITIMDQAQRKTREIIGKTDIRKLEKEKHTFTFDGETVELTTAQIMSLHELMKRQQAVDHVMIGGVRPESVKKGIKDLPPARPWHLTQDQVSEVVDSMTPEQVKLADELQKYMGGTMAELGNEASMEVYGYRKFTEKHYFPISVDKNQTQSDVKNDAVSGIIAGWGSARPVKPNANNAVILRSIFDVYADHVTEMANYASWLAPMENMNRIFNFRYKDAEGNPTGTFKDQLEKLFGRNGAAYWKQLQADLNNGVHGRDDSPFSAFMGTYKASAIGANIRVIAQQPTAILRAMDSINPADFVAGMARARIGKFDKVVKQYAPIAIWKDWGYFQQDTGRQMRNVLFNDDTKLQKANSAMMWGAGKADSLSWTAIWNALESETRRKRKDLRYKSKEFYEAVAERFNEVVDHTQVVDGILQRSQIMRSADGLTKMATSFMAEPTKTYNMMLSAIYEARNAKGRERSAAMGKLAKTAFALTVSITVNAAAQSLVDAIRDDDKDEDYWEKFIQAYFGLEGETRKEQIKNGILNGNLEAAFNPLTYIPYLKDIVSQTQGYTVSRMDMDTISRVLKAFQNVEKAMSGEGKNTRQSAWLNLTAEVARFLGIPAANIKRDIQTITRTFFAGTGNYRMLYEQEKFLYDVTSKNTLTEFSKLILGAERAGDDEAAQAIRQDMIDSGVDAEKIDKKLAELRKKAVTDTEEYQTALAQKTDAYHTMLEADARFNGLDEDKQENVRKRLNDYAQYQVLGQSMDVENDKMEKIADAESHKVPAADWVVFTAAADAIEADYKPDGTLIQGSKKKKVVALIDSYDIPNEGKSYMYLSQGYSEKDNPYQ